MVKIFAVLQLCFVFISLCWHGGYPFMGELFELRTQMFIARTVTGDPDLLQYVPENKREQAEKTLEGNQLRFRGLPTVKQGEIGGKIGAIQTQMDRSVWAKFQQGASLLLFDLPLLKRAWLFMALALSLGLLLGMEGAATAAWVLPLLAFAHLSFSYKEAPLSDPVAALYPRVEELPPGDDFQAQWQEYVEKTWGAGRGIGEGEFRFNLALLEAYGTRPPASEQPLFLSVFFAWNLLFAYSVNKTQGEKRRAKKARHPPMDCSCHPAGPPLPRR